MAFLDRSRDAQDAAKLEADIERRWLAGWSYLPLAIVAVPFIFAHDWIAAPLSAILQWLISMSPGLTDLTLGDKEWLNQLLAGAPTALVYLLLAPYTKKRFRDKALADSHRQARAGESGEARETAATLPDVSAVDVHATAYAGFWRRAAAQAVDWVICLIPAIAIAYKMLSALLMTQREGLLLLVPLVWILIFWLYHAFAWTSKLQATPGMWLVRIFVTDLQGRRLGWGRASARHFARFLSYYTVGVGFAIQPWNLKRQTLHDRLSGTVVLMRPPKPKAIDAAIEPLERFEESGRPG
jgi:uncharacterized RDD family membrane protein YckC